VYSTGFRDCSGIKVTDYRHEDLGSILLDAGTAQELKRLTIGMKIWVPFYWVQGLLRN
jgi:hypothetical protein